jgi:histidine triad (HIT) family protein
MCLFCEIIAGNIPSTKVYEDENILAFKDINPVAPVHIIVVPKEHIESANEITAENSKYVSYIFEKMPEIAKSQGIDSYRVINNCGEDAGQTIKHLHFHIVGGVKMGEKII